MVYSNPPAAASVAIGFVRVFISFDAFWAVLMSLSLNVFGNLVFGDKQASFSTLFSFLPRGDLLCPSTCPLNVEVVFKV
jgi:hypothetical protein